MGSCLPVANQNIAICGWVPVLDNNVVNLVRNDTAVVTLKILSVELN